MQGSLTEYFLLDAGAFAGRLQTRTSVPSVAHQAGAEWQADIGCPCPQKRPPRQRQSPIVEHQWSAKPPPTEGWVRSGLLNGELSRVLVTLITSCGLRSSMEETTSASTTDAESKAEAPQMGRKLTISGILLRTQCSGKRDKQGNAHKVKLATGFGMFRPSGQTSQTSVRPLGHQIPCGAVWSNSAHLV